MDVVDSFLTGSYSRKTMIAPLKEADVDIFIQLDAKYFHHYNHGQNGGQAGLLDLVKRTLKKTYTRAEDKSSRKLKNVNTVCHFPSCDLQWQCFNLTSSLGDR